MTAIGRKRTNKSRFKAVELTFIDFKIQEMTGY